MLMEGGERKAGQEEWSSVTPGLFVPLGVT